MSYLTEYTTTQRLAHEVRILLTLIEVEEEAGRDLTGVFLYQREKIYALIKDATHMPSMDMPRMESWQPIETAPDDVDTLVWCADRDRSYIGYRARGCVQKSDTDDNVLRPTHWMPLPDAPTT